MSERACVRGCMARDVHFAACPSWTATGTCTGCVPVEAMPGALVCERCYRRIRKHIDEAPDLLAHLRSIADPTKAVAFDRIRVQSSRPDLPAPVAADLIDAADDIMRTLRAWAAGDEHGPAAWVSKGLSAGVDAATAYDEARACADDILTALDAIANDAHLVVELSGDFLDRSTEREPSRWTVADALTRWSLEEHPRTAKEPCPECSERKVRVSPPRRRGQAIRYACLACGWLADSNDDGGLWADAFSEDLPEVEVRPHDPRWLTLAAAAKLARVTPPTMRRWADRDLVKRVDGRYWRPDIDDVVLAKRGETA